MMMTREVRTEGAGRQNGRAGWLDPNYGDTDALSLSIKVGTVGRCYCTCR